MGSVATVGMFDGVHLGHQMMVGQVCRIAADHGLTPMVFTFDRHPMMVVNPERAPKMLTTMAQRADRLVAAGAERVVELRFDERMRALSASDFMIMLHAVYGVEMLVVGFNHHFGKDRAGTFADYQAIGHQIGMGVVCADEYIGADGQGISSSAVREALLAGDIERANQMLGYVYQLSGIVVHGRHLGHSLGFPTANVSPYTRQQLVPKAGVYAAMVDLGVFGVHRAMVNVGTNPTVSGVGGPLSIEANIFDYEGDLYGHPVSVRFVSRIRDERRFPSLEALKSQLQADREAALVKITAVGSHPFADNCAYRWKIDICQPWIGCENGVKRGKK